LVELLEFMGILQVEGFIDWLYEVEIKFLVQERFGIDEGELITIILKGVSFFIIGIVKKFHKRRGKPKIYD